MSGSRRHGTPSTEQATGAAFELFFGYPDEAAYAAAVERPGRRPRRQPASPPRTPRCGARTPRRRPPSGSSWVAPARGQPRRWSTEIAALRGRAAPAGVDQVVLCGMGGSSLAPEVICGAAGVELDVLDSSDPDFVRTALEDRLADTVVVVSSKSGGTVETDSQRRAFEKAFADAGIDPAERIVVVTDPGSAARGVGARRPATACSSPTPTSAAATRR